MLTAERDIYININTSDYILSEGKLTENDRVVFEVL